MGAAMHHYHFFFDSILPGDVPRPASRPLPPADADAFALADGVEGKPDVLSDDAAFGRAHRAGLPGQIAAQELTERALADETDPGRVALREIVQPRLFRDCAHHGLLQFPDRENHARELLLVQPMQEVALVLG